MAVHEEVADRRLAQQLVDARHVTTFAQPHAGRPAAEVLLVVVGGHVHLGAQGRPVAVEQWEEGVRRRRGDDLEPARVLQLAERRHDVAIVAAPGVAQAVEAAAIHLGQAMVLGLGLGALQLLLGEQDQIVEVVGVAHLEQVVGEHRDERRRQRNRAAVGDVVRLQTLEHLQERQVGTRDGLVKPLLLHHRGILRVANEGKVGVQNQREVSGGHGG